MIRNVLALVILLCLGFAGWSVWRQLDHPIQAVRVQGALSQAEQTAIRDVVSANLGVGVLSLDVDELTRNIRALSWPRSVQVRRVWPDTLMISVEKESVVAAWGDGGYLTSAGKVVRLAEGEPAVPTLNTSLSSPRQAMEIYQMLQSQVSPAGFSILELSENALGEWLLVFDGGMTVALGNDSASARLQRFLLAYRSQLSERQEQIVHVDARYSNGIAVQWRDVGVISRSRISGTLLAADSRSASRSGDRSYGGGGESIRRDGDGVR